MAKPAIKTQNIPQEVFEFVMTQLILRSVGFKTSEMTPIFDKAGENLSSIDMELKRSDKTELISLGFIALDMPVVLKNWISWTELAAKEILDNFKVAKSEYANLVAYKTMNTLLKHLEEVGFELVSTEILSTFN
jgi:hypothetical protein